MESNKTPLAIIGQGDTSEEITEENAPSLVTIGFVSGLVVGAGLFGIVVIAIAIFNS